MARSMHASFLVCFYQELGMPARCMRYSRLHEALRLAVHVLVSAHASRPLWGAMLGTELFQGAA